MALILDGYNLIGALDRYREAGTPRRRPRAPDKRRPQGGGVDGKAPHRRLRRPPGSRVPRGSRSRAGGAVRVIYSAPGESADDVIERLLSRLEGSATVYTADFALQRTALARGATRATPREFANLLDELPAITRSPDVRRKSRIADRLSLETLRRAGRDTPAAAADGVALQHATPCRAPLSAKSRRCRRGVCAVTISGTCGTCRQDGLDELLADSEGRKARSVLKVEAAGRNVLTSGGRRPERADKLAKPACGAAPAAPRPGSSEVEQPPCKRPVGGSNPFPGSRLEVRSAPSTSVEKSVAFATIFGRSAQSAAGAWPGVCPSGQREQTVNLPASPTEVRILPPPHRQNMPL